MPQVASADTLSLAQYRQRLQNVRSNLVAARANTSTARGDLARTAQTLLRTTTAITVGTSTLTIDDSALADFAVTDTGLDGSIARLDAQILLVSRLGSPSIDAATADARLRDVVRQSGPAASGDIFAVLGQLVLRFISGLRNPGIDPRIIETALGALGVAVILFIVATLGRALPERVRREVLVRDAVGSSRDDPAVHLRAADAAIGAGRSREAIHELYLYVIASLEQREAIHYDPALTDQELLLRAAAIPHAEALRALVSSYERAWFGLREPTAAESQRARELALRVAP